MSRLVLVAKNAHVWLAQLSAKYGREITTLDGIPDEELEILAELGDDRTVAHRGLGAQPGI